MNNNSPGKKRIKRVPLYGDAIVLMVKGEDGLFVDRVFVRDPMVEVNVMDIWKEIPSYRAFAEIYESVFD